jgi:hypothetical protein
MRKLHIDIISKTIIKDLQVQDEESNGRISFDRHGNVTEIVHRKGQIMEECKGGCVINFHTHPPDFVNLYPEHPSKQDMKYIYSATCYYSELGAHMIFTPSFVYVIWHNCNDFATSLWNQVSIGYRIDRAFNKSDALHDRSTDAFRRVWINECKRLGFEIIVFTYDNSIDFEIPNKQTLPIPSAAKFVLLTLLIVYVVKFFPQKIF